MGGGERQGDGLSGTAPQLTTIKPTLQAAVALALPVKTKLPAEGTTDTIPVSVASALWITQRTTLVAETELLVTVALADPAATANWPVGLLIVTLPGVPELSVAGRDSRPASFTVPVVSIRKCSVLDAPPRIVKSPFSSGPRDICAAVMPPAVG